MTPNPPTETPADDPVRETRKRPVATSWKNLDEQLQDADGERHEFFPLKQVGDGETVTAQLIGEPVFDPKGFHGKFSMLEMDIRVGSQPYRLCVSGSRLAKALASVEPQIGDTIVLTAKGPDGRERKWSAIKRKVVAVTTLNGHA